MKEILRSQLFQLKREKILYVIFAVMLAAAMYVYRSSIFDMKDTMAVIDGGNGAINMASMPCFAAMLFAAVTVPIIMGRDYSGGMIHCDVLTGHSRREAFLGRLIPTFALISAGSIVLAAVPVFSIGLTHGWGETLPVSAYLIRLAVFWLFEMRICAELVLAVVLLRKIYLVYLATLAVYIYEANLMIMSSHSFNKLMASVQYFHIMRFEFRMIGHISSGTEFVYLPGEATGDLIFFSLTSAAAAIICTAAAYKIFEHDDM